MLTVEHVEDALRKHIDRHGITVCTICRGWQNVVYHMLKACIERNQTTTDQDDINQTLERYASNCTTFEIQES